MTEQNICSRRQALKSFAIGLPANLLQVLADVPAMFGYCAIMAGVRPRSAIACWEESWIADSRISPTTALP